jgi:hypothetical protein
LLTQPQTISVAVRLYSPQRLLHLYCDVKISFIVLYHGFSSGEHQFFSRELAAEGILAGKYLWNGTRSCQLFLLLQSARFALGFVLDLDLDRLSLQIGACRHGDRCSRKHIKPPFSQTILLPNVYHNPAHDPVCKLTETELQEGFDAVYEDLYCELSKFGHLLELHVRGLVTFLDLR